MRLNKIVKFLKKYGGMIFNFIVFVSLGIFLLLNVDIEQLEQFIKNFGVIGRLMIVGYVLVGAIITEIVNWLICFILKKIKDKRIMKNKIFQEIEKLKD